MTKKACIIPGYVTLTLICRKKEIVEVGDVIPEFAFEERNDIFSVEISGGVKKIKKCAFVGCRSMVSVKISYGVEYIGQASFTSCESLVSVTFPGTVRNIEHHAFFLCRSLSRVKIFEKGTRIGYDAFRQTRYESRDFRKLRDNYIPLWSRENHSLCHAVRRKRVFHAFLVFFRLEIPVILWSKIMGYISVWELGDIPESFLKIEKNKNKNY